MGSVLTFQHLLFRAFKFPHGTTDGHVVHAKVLTNLRHWVLGRTNLPWKTGIDKRNDTRYVEVMIRTFKNRALKKLYEKGDPSKIKPDHAERVEDILFRLDNAMQPKDMDLPGWNLHKLSGKLKGFSAVWVSDNFRIWFRMEDGDVFDVDYGDYH